MYSILYYIVLYFKFHIRIFVDNQIDIVFYNNYLEIILYPFSYSFIYSFVYLFNKYFSNNYYDEATCKIEKCMCEIANVH